MKIVVAGATGFIGSALTRSLVDRGDSVVALTRNPDRAATRVATSMNTLAFDLNDSDGQWARAVADADAVVNLAGEPVADKRWTAQRKQRILTSRLETTRALVEALGKSGAANRNLINGSAIGYYGSRGDEQLTETSEYGSDFLADVVVQWEAEANRARAAGTRVVVIRTGIVLGAGGGALPPMSLPFKLFAGGVIGPPDQWMSWIHIDDEVGIIMKAIDDASISGPVNATSPNPVTAPDFSRSIGRALRRPVWAPGIPVAMRIILGERAEVVFASLRVAPEAIQSAGYEFRFTELGPALDTVFAGG